MFAAFRIPPPAFRVVSLLTKPSASQNLKTLQQLRLVSSAKKMAPSANSIVLGVYDPIDSDDGKVQQNVVGTKYFHQIDQAVGNSLSTFLARTGYFDKKIKCGTVRIASHVAEVALPGIDGKTKPDVVVLVGLGSQNAGVDELEQWDQRRENIRIAAGAAARALESHYCGSTLLDTFGDEEAAAEGSHLQLFAYDQLKSQDKKKDPIKIDPIGVSSSDDKLLNAWQRGVILAEGQSYARELMETPSNLKMPPMLAERIAKDLLQHTNAKVTVTIRDESWIKSKNMGAFLSVTQGSHSSPRLLEIKYQGAGNDTAPIAVVGKGITFDTGGISLKPSLNMDMMRGDMGGAACTAASIWTAARLGLPVNLLGIIPICENMPGGGATRPGDVVTAMNGKTIQVDNTDAEGRLILCDALCYAQEFNPRLIVDLATLTGAIRIALGAGAAGVYTNHLPSWETMRQASIVTGDRVWPMPLFRLYGKQMTDCHLADINNVAPGGQGGSCTAAGFLREFIKKDTKWMHMDIAGVSDNKDEVPYLRKGLSGRPTRTLVEFYRRLSGNA